MNLSSFWQTLDAPSVDINVGINEWDSSSLASVLIAITQSDTDPQIILTKRPESMTTHAGQVAFPGGRFEFGDQSLVDTALRESEEEINLSPHQVTIRGRLNELLSLHGLMVYPFVATVPEQLDLKPNPLEIESIFMFPLRHLLEKEPDRVDDVTRRGVRVRMPAWYYEGYEIWGLTAMLLDQMRRRFVKMDI